MHPEIEKLIELALADGEVTEKERSVIFRKAAALGVDPDEVEMTLDARLYQLKAERPQPHKQKFGDIIRCPACGAEVKSFEPECSQCGHEFSNVRANSTLNKLIDDLNKIDNTANNSLIKAIDDTRKMQLKNELISSFPIPNSREDILEFLAYSVSKSSNQSFTELIHERGSGWQKKAHETIIKAKIMFKGDLSFIKQIEGFESDFNRSKNNRLRIIALIAAVYILILIFRAIR